MGTDTFIPDCEVLNVLTAGPQDSSVLKKSPVPIATQALHPVLTNDLLFM